MRTVPSCLYTLPRNTEQSLRHIFTVGAMKEYFYENMPSMANPPKHIRQYPKKVNYKFVCKENDFVDKMIFIISGLYNEYKNNECDSFYCADKEIQQKLNFSKKVYELLKI